MCTYPVWTHSAYPAKKGMGTAEKKEYFLLCRNCSGDSLYSNRIETLDCRFWFIYIEFDSKYMMVMQVQKHKVSSGFNTKGTMVHFQSWKR